MLKSKIGGPVQEVILPDFPDDDNTVTTTVTKSRRVSFGTNFVKEFIVGSAVSAQCIGEYEQAFPSSDSSNADSSHSAGESEISDNNIFMHESHKVHKSTVPTVSQTNEPDSLENRPKPPKFSSTICFSADSPTADMEFTEGCLTLAKSILDKKNKEMTVIIQAKPKETKDDEKPKEDETKYFDASQFEMSMTRCLKSKENKREEKRFESEKTKIYSKFEDEMSITRCNKVFIDDESDSSWENCKENRLPLDMIMSHLDKDNSDFESDLFNPEKSFNNLLNPNLFDFSHESEKLNLNESMDISTDFQPNVLRNLQKTTSDEKLNESNAKASKCNRSEKLNLNESMEISGEIQDGGNNASDILPFPDSKTENENQFEKLSTGSEPMQFTLLKEAEFEKVSAVSMKAVPLDISKSVETSPKSESKIIDVKLTSLENTNEGLKEADEITEELGGVFFKETENDKAVSGESENLKSPEKLFSSDNENPENFPVNEDRINNEKSVAEKHSIEIQSNTSEAPSPPWKITCRQSSEHENSEAMNFSQSKMCQSPSREQKMTEKSTELNISEKLNIENPAELSKEFQPEADKIHNGSENPSVEKPMEISLEEAKTAQNVENPNDDFILNKNTERSDDCDEENFQDVMEISSNVQGNLSKLPEKPSTVEVVDSEKLTPNESLDVASNIRANCFESPQTQSTEDFNEISEPSLVDIKVIESLKEQSEEPGCLWSLKDLQHPQGKSPGLLSFDCVLLESVTNIQFILKASKQNSLDSCSVVANSEISLKEEDQCRVPEYELVIGFGFKELKKSFHDRRQKVETIRHIPYFLDQINSFLFKMNSNLGQIHSILTLYPGSRLRGSVLSFRLYSFPIFFSCLVFIDLTNLFGLSDSSLSFENDFGSFDENKIRKIFQDCLKHENSLCEFVIQSTKYLFELEKESGYVSKRSHIRLLPAELKL